MTNNSNKVKRKVLTFEGRDGKTYEVKERTMSQIYKVLDSYMDYVHGRKGMNTFMLPKKSVL